MLILKRPPLLAALLLAAGAALAYALRAKPSTTAAAKPPPLVSVTMARQQDLPLESAAQGHLVALNQSAGDSGTPTT